MNHDPKIYRYHRFTTQIINGVNFGGEIHCLLQKLYLHWLTVLMELNKLVLSPRPAALPRVIIG